MYKCPCCHKETISAWKKIGAHRLNPIMCPACSGLSYVPLKYSRNTLYLLMFLGVLIWSLVILLKSGWPLLIAFPVIVWSQLDYLKRAPLIPKN